MKLYAKNKKIAYVMLALVLVGNTNNIQADEHVVDSEIIKSEDTPDNIIENIIEECFSIKNAQNSFFHYIQRIIEVINNHKSYFIAKYGETMVTNLLADLPKLKHAKTKNQVQKILDKYKSSSLFDHNKARINPAVAGLILMRRLNNK